jgi:ribosome-binding protein aMBF1 (putative translation factor)
MKTKNLENFQKLVSNEESGWLDKFLHYKANQKKLDNSSKVAVNVLEALRDKKMSQKDLAEKMNVSAQQINKIVRGQQNLTFGTIGKLEDALDITLMEIIDFKPVNKIKANATLIKAIQKTKTEKIAPNNSFSDDFIKKEGTQMKVVYNATTQPTSYQKAI